MHQANARTCRAIESTRKQLQEWQKSSAYSQMSQKPLTYLLVQGVGAETRRTAWGMLQMRRPHAETCIAIETAQERLQKHAKPLANPQRSQKCQIHLLVRRYGAKARATAWGTMWMDRTCAGTRSVLERTQKRLKTRTEKSKLTL